MEARMRRVAPLVDQLQKFCRGHSEVDHGAAATEVLAYLRGAWPDIPSTSLPAERGEAFDVEELALAIVRDVGETAALLLESPEPGEALAWSRANLIFDLERYLIAVEPLT